MKLATKIMNRLLKNTDKQIHASIPIQDTEGEFTLNLPMSFVENFPTEAYLEQNSDVAEQGIDALVHYVQFGLSEGRFLGDGVEMGLMAAVNNKRAKKTLHQMLLKGLDERLEYLPQELLDVFDPDAYRKKHADVRDTSIDPLAHYMKYGLLEGRQYSEEFNRKVLELCNAGSKLAGVIRLLQLGALPKGLPDIVLDEDLVADNLGAHEILPEGLSIACGIVLYNNETEEIERLATSIKKSRGLDEQNVKIIVINNGEPLEDSMKDVIEEHDIFQLENKDGNLGSGAGHTRLMKYAFNTLGAEAYLTLNPDGFFHPRCLERMVKMAYRHDWSTAVEAAQLPNENGKYFDPHYFDTEWAVTACALFTKKIFNVVGGFDPNIFLYCDDVDYGWMIRRAGFTVKYCPTAYYFHDYASRTASSAFFMQNRLEAGRYLAHKWGNPEFRLRCERELIEEGFHETTDTMPQIGPLAQLEPPLDAANFENDFVFATNRW